MSQDYSLLDAVVDLTAQRDLDTLACAMVRVVSSVKKPAKVSMYALQGELGNLSAKVLASTDALEVGNYLTGLNTRPHLRECIDHQHTIKHVADGKSQSVYPIIEQGAVTGLLTCESSIAAGTPPQLVERLIAIYANHRSLLNHQQRDGLTGLFNRASLDNWLHKALALGMEPGRRADDITTPGCFAIFDIDHFKCVNDTLGHLYGDEVLLIFSELMRESFRFNDLLFRYGGEEFVAVLTDTDLDTAISVLQRFRTKVASHHFPQINQITVTIGVVQIEPRLLPTTLIDRADKALYYGKNHGRNQVNAYEWLLGDNMVHETTDQPQTIELF